MTNGSDWIVSRYGIEEVTVERVSKAKAFSDYIIENEFETMKVFERENISVTQPALENISVTQPNLEKKYVSRPALENMSVTQPTSLTGPLTRPPDFREENRNGNVPDDLDPDPSLSKLSSKIKELDVKKKCRKHRKDDSSDPSSSDNSDLSDNSDYRRKQRKKKTYQEKDLIKLCTRLMEKLPTTAYK